MEILASTISSTIKEIGKCLYVPVERHIGYLIAYKRNVETLRNQVQKLGTIRDDVKGRIELAQCRGEVIKGVVEDWITKVDRIEEEARRFDDEVNENKRCFGEWCPNFRSRYGLGKKAKKMVVKVNSLQPEGDFNAVSDPAPHPSILSIPTGDFVDFESTKSAMNQVMDALKDENINIVGVYGLGGVGKTSLMEQIGRQMKEANLYNEVVKVTVSQNPVLEKIQTEISEKIGLVIHETSEEARAARLCARLKQSKGVLLILDDLWEQLELSKVGIPFGNEHEGCKIVVTTRNLQVCTAMMSQATIEVKVLSADDSWVLFKKYAGDFIETPSFRTVARDVVKECGGLPLAIITLGRALRVERVSYWNDALIQLKRSNPTDIIGLDTKVFNSLMLSYNASGSEDMKSCFLFCCLFPEDYDVEIEKLLQYGIGEGLYKGALTLNEARGRVRILVENLKARCLLLEGDRKECVKMHDILRDLAIKISSENEDKFLVKAGQGLERWPEREEVDKCHKISLMNNKIRFLPDQPPTCPKLRTLILSNNYFFLEVIPDNFFEGMKNLVVLDLSYTSISFLPSSFSCLTNLRTLCLEGCHSLRNMSSLGGLTKLEILRLKSSSLNNLPEEIGELTNLKLLDLQYNSDLKVVPPNVISRLTFLEELPMKNNDFRNWELPGKGPGHNASFAEVASLAYLTVLHVNINDVEILSQEIYCGWKNLTEFHIRVGEEDISSFHPREIRGRRSMNLQVSNPLANWVKDLAKRTDELYITVPKNSSFENVKPLLKSSCLTALYVDTTDTGILSQDICCRWTNLTEFGIRVGEEDIFHPWEIRGRHSMKLQVSNPLANWVKELAERTKYLYLTVPKNSSFENVKPLLKSSCLTALYVDTTDMGILSQDICCRWTNLTEFGIRVGESAQHAAGVWKKCIMSLDVCGPIAFASWVMELAERTEDLDLTVDNNFADVVPLINRNPNSLKSLRFNVQQEREHLIKVEDVQENAFSRLERLYLSNLGKVKKLCEGPIPSGFFGNLSDLQLRDCNNLRYLWPFFPCHASQQLESLEIHGCKELEGLIPRKEEESVVMEVIASPMLCEAPNLLPPLLAFQNLRRLHISNCPSLKYIFSWKFANGLNRLEELYLRGCDGIEVIFAEVGMVDSRVLPQLKTLILRQLRSLVSFFQGEASLDMTSLEIIIIEDCKNLKRLPVGTQSAPNLKQFTAQKEWFEALEWREGSITKSCLEPLLFHKLRKRVSFDKAERTPIGESGMSDQAAETFANKGVV